MELTENQIEQVVNYIDNKNFNYIDLRDEILDHMICDIESLLSRKNLFKDAFKLTTLKWDKQFKYSSSFYLGLLYSDARIVIKKAIKLFKPYFTYNLISYFTVVIFFKNIKFNISKNTITSINNLIVLVTILCMFYIVFIALKIYKTKIKTTYSFILKTQYLAITSMLLVVFMGGIFDAKGFPSAILLGLLLSSYSLVFGCHQFYNKHLKIINNYKNL